MSDIVDDLRDYAGPSNYPATMLEAADEIARLRAALEWALDHAGTDHPHYPYRAADAWAFPYLVSNAGGFGGGVGEEHFATALEAVERAALAQKEETE